MANDLSGPGVLLMGSIFEITQLIFFDLVTAQLMELTDQSPEQVRARHVNLE